MITPLTRDTREEEHAAAHYRDLWTAHGDSYRALDWGSRASQQRRFEVLANGCQLQGARILDVGCGLAHFADWLRTRHIMVDYTGLDITAELLTQAAARHPGHRFVRGSVLDPDILRDETFDIVIASGVFCSYPDAGPAWVHAAIDRMWQWTTKTMAFNSLSAWAAQDTPSELHADPMATLAFCRTLSPRVALRHDYHPRDFTVHVFREEDR
jgi:SAM-dependent methyltransferase